MEPTNESKNTLAKKISPTCAIRRWARRIDTIILALTFFIILMGLPVNSPIKNIPFYFIWPAFLIATLVLEPILLSICGYTPGKWLFNIKIRKDNGSKITIGDGARRTFKVISQGVFFGIPILSMGQKMAFRETIEKEGQAAWDKELGLQANYNKIGMLNVLTFAFGIAIYMTMLNYLFPYNKG